MTYDGILRLSDTSSGLTTKHNIFICFFSFIFVQFPYAIKATTVIEFIFYTVQTTVLISPVPFDRFKPYKITGILPYNLVKIKKKKKNNPQRKH